MRFRFDFTERWYAKCHNTILNHDTEVCHVFKEDDMWWFVDENGTAWSINGHNWIFYNDAGEEYGYEVFLRIVIETIREELI
jgi:hypothetical protein